MSAVSVRLLEDVRARGRVDLVDDAPSARLDPPSVRESSVSFEGLLKIQAVGRRRGRGSQATGHQEGEEGGANFHAGPARPDQDTKVSRRRLLRPVWEGNRGWLLDSLHCAPRPRGSRRSWSSLARTMAQRRSILKLTSAVAGPGTAGFPRRMASAGREGGDASPARGIRCRGRASGLRREFRETWEGG